MSRRHVDKTDWVQVARAHIAVIDGGGRPGRSNTASSIASSFRTVRTGAAAVGDDIEDVVPSVRVRATGEPVCSVNDVKRMVHKVGSANILDEEKTELLDLLESLDLTPGLASSIAMPRDDGKDVYSVVDLLFRSRSSASGDRFFHAAMAFVTQCLRLANHHDSGMGKVALHRMDQRGLLKKIIQTATGFHQSRDSAQFSLDDLSAIANRFSEHEDSLLAVIKASGPEEHDHASVTQCLQAPANVSARALPRVQFGLASASSFASLLVKDFDRLERVLGTEDDALRKKVFYLHCLYPSGHGLIGPGLKRSSYITTLRDIGQLIADSHSAQKMSSTPKGLVWFAWFRDLKFPCSAFDRSSLRIPPKYLQFVTAVRLFKLNTAADDDGLVDVYLVDVGICAMARPDQLFQLQGVTSLIEMVPLLHFAKVLCPRRDLEVPGQCADLLMQLSVGLDPYIVSDDLGGSKNISDWQVFLDCNHRGLQLLAVKALKRLAYVSHAQPGLTGPRHTNDRLTHLCVKVATILREDCSDSSDVYDGVFFLFYAMDYMPVDKLKETYHRAGIDHLLGKIRAAGDSSLDSVLDRISHFQTDDGLWHNTGVRQLRQRHRQVMPQQRQQLRQMMPQRQQLRQMPRPQLPTEAAVPPRLDDNVMNSKEARCASAPRTESRPDLRRPLKVTKAVLDSDKGQTTRAVAAGVAGEKKNFYMSRSEISPRLQYKVTTKSPEVRIKDDEENVDGDAEGSMEMDFSYGKIVTIPKENRSMVVFCEKVPSQQVCGQHICALLNNQQRGVLVLGVTSAGIVRGVLMDRKDKDLFRQGVDNTLRRMDPANPLDEDLILPPVFRPVANHPSALRADLYPRWDAPPADKTPMVIQVEVRPPSGGRQFTYDGEAFARTQAGDSVRVATVAAAQSSKQNH